jgi:transposase
MLALSDSLPENLAAAHAMILALRSEAKVWALEIERLKLMLAKARREQFGQSSERGKQLIEQLELAIEDLEESQAEEETKAEIAAPAAAKEKRARGPRKLPDNLPGRTHCRAGALRLRQMRRFEAAQAWRSRDQNA